VAVLAFQFFFWAQSHTLSYMAYQAVMPRQLHLAKLSDFVLIRILSFWKELEYLGK
jgi:hypothetical protein